MNYVIWRHDNAFGNTAEQVLCLATHLKDKMDTLEYVLVEHGWQKQFVLLIPGIRDDQIVIFGSELGNSYKNKWKISGFASSSISVPSYYASAEAEFFPCGWEFIPKMSEPILKSNLISEDAFDVVIQFRERGSWNRRIDGRFSEPQRDVSVRVFHKLIQRLANSGYTIARIGDSVQKPLGQHFRIKDYATTEPSDLLRDLKLINSCHLFISTDSSIWPLAAGLGKSLLMTNVASIFPAMRTSRKVLYKIFFPTDELFFSKNISPIKPEIISWMIADNIVTLSKKPIFIGLGTPFRKGYGVVLMRSNSFRQIFCHATTMLEKSIR